MLADMLLKRSGQPRRAFRRLLLHKSGLPRRLPSAELRARLRAAGIAAWVDEAGLPALPAHPRRARLVAEPPATGTPPAAERIARTAQGLTIAGTGWTEGDGSLPVLVVDATAQPRPAGPAALLAALDGHPQAAIAYGDELYRDARGRLAGHWFKPPQTDPLLAARGGLFGGTVALAPRHPAAAQALRDIASGTRSVRDALAALGAELGPEEAIHVDGPVLEDTLPRPAPLPPPPAPALPDPPRVTVIIPTRDRWDLLGPCLASLADTDWPADRLEILVIDNGSQDPETLAGLSAAAAAGQVRVLRDTRAFNYAALNNAAARVASGTLLVFLNNDTVARRADWLRRLAAQALRPEAGAVGCKLLYRDGTVQHAGVIFGYRGRARHLGVGLAADEGGYAQLALLDRQVSAVTAACLAVRKAAFDAVGGLREEFRVAYNDAAFCADLHVAGYRNYVLADALFTHFENKSRGKDDTPEKKALHARENALLHRLHPDLFRQDPFYSRCLSQKHLHELVESPRLG